MTFNRYLKQSLALLGAFFILNLKMSCARDNHLEHNAVCTLVNENNNFYLVSKDQSWKLGQGGGK